MTTQPTTRPAWLPALVVRPDHTLSHVTLDAAEVLRGLYATIGCELVDVVRLAGNLDMWIDDEGLITGQPVNFPASRIARSYEYDDQPYFGTAVFTGGADSMGATLGLTLDVSHHLTGLLARAAT